MRILREEAASQVTGLLVAATLVTAFLGTLLWQGQDVRVDPRGHDHAVQELNAAALLDVLLDTRGEGWEGGPDAVTRLGLADSNGTGLELAHLQAMQGGKASGTASNGKVDRDDALLSLGLDPDRYGMHLRVTPKADLETAQTQRALGSMRTALVADWEKLVGASVLYTSDDEALVAQARAEVSTRMAADAARDRALLSGLGLHFEDRIHLGATFPQVLVDLPTPLPDVPLYDHVSNVTLLRGDVYPDHKEYLQETLKERIWEYQLLVIGSHVDHKTLAEGELKHRIHNWTEAGGVLIVLGSTLSVQTWLDPLLTGVSYQTGVAGPIHDPSLGHLALTSPHLLRWNDYAFHGNAWNITTSQMPGWHAFTHPLKAQQHSVLAISKEGAFGSGRAAFSSLSIDDVWGVLGEGEAKAYLVNVILHTAMGVHAATTLYYGDPVPSDLPIASAYRTTQSWFPGYGLVPLEARLLLWEEVDG